MSACHPDGALPDGAAAVARLYGGIHPTGRPRAAEAASWPAPGPRCANCRHREPTGIGAGYACAAQDGRPWLLLSWPARDLWSEPERQQGGDVLICDLADPRPERQT